MDIDALKAEWRALDGKVQASLRIGAWLARDARATRIGRYRAREAWRMVPSLVLDVIALALLGSFIGDHWREPRFLVPALALDVFVLFFTIASARQWALVHSVDHGAPIVATQRKLERLTLERVWMTKWVILLSPLLWTPLFIVAMKGLLGVDAYRAFGMLYIVANLVVGIVAIPILWWLARRLGARLQGRPLLRRLCDDVAGGNLTAASAYLASLAALEEEG
jgi:hypothetical protein